MNEIKIETGILAGLSELIDRKNNDLIGVTNVELVTLFWQIGKQVGQYLNAKKKGQQSKYLLSCISEELTVRLGKVFTSRNLTKMRLLAVQFPDIHSVTNISRILGWKHIIALLSVKEHAAQKYYIELTVNQGLTPIELENAISNNMMVNSTDISPRSKGKVNDKYNSWWSAILFKGLEQPGLRKLMEREFSQRYRSADFQKLLAPAFPDEPSSNRACTRTEEDNLLTICIQEVEKFRRSHNRWLNTRLNGTFREIGAYLIMSVKSIKDETNRRNFIDILSQKLTSKYGSNFTQPQLLSMMQFYQNVSEPVSVRISNLITWGHLLEIITLREPEQQLFYARLTATWGLSAINLKDEIKEKRYFNSPEAEKVEKLTLRLLQNPQGLTSNEPSKNRIKLSKYLIDVGNDIMDSKVTGNIFQNQYFPLVQKLRVRY